MTEIDFTNIEKRWWRSRSKWPGRYVIVGCLAMAGLMIALSGCNPGDWFRLPNGNPAMVSSSNGSYIEETGRHIDNPTITATDRFCALTDGCPFWDRPKYRYWQLPVYHDWMGSWWVVTTGEWENYLTCDYYNPEWYCQDATVTGPRG